MEKMTKIEKARSEFKVMMEHKVGRTITEEELNAGWQEFIAGINKAEAKIRSMASC